MKILIVLTSTEQIPGSDRRTGAWFEEVAAPYYIFQSAGAEVVLASVAGGPAPIDPMSEMENFQSEYTRKFADDADAQTALKKTLRLADVKSSDYDAVFYSGGLGPVFDLTEDADSIALIERMFHEDKPIAAVCHGVASLRNAHTSGGKSLIQGRNVTGFSNGEERAAHSDGIVPFLVEDELRRLGGNYSSGPDWTSHVVVDGRLITGQNPASSEGAARKLLEVVRG
jgi:putative intracellular protease/amidase